MTEDRDDITYVIDTSILKTSLINLVKFIDIYSVKLKLKTFHEKKPIAFRFKQLVLTITFSNKH